LAVKVFLVLLENWKRTVWPCPNQPAEKVTAPGSIESRELLVTKFKSCVRQLGVGLSNFFVWTDFFNIGSMTTVDCSMLSYFILNQISVVFPGRESSPSVPWKANPEDTIILSVLSSRQALEDPKICQIKDQEIWIVFYLVHLEHARGKILRHPKGFVL
jgi:hypothetical protein